LADELDPEIDPQAERLIYVSNQGGNRDLWQQPLAGGAPQRLTRHSADDFDPAWSPAGRRLAFTSLRHDAKGDIFLLVEEDEPPRRLTDRSSADRQPSWSPDGRWLAFASARGNAPEAIHRLEPDSGRRRRLSRRPGFDPAVSPDGRFLLFTSLTEPPGGGPAVACLWLHRLHDGAEHPVGDCRRPTGFADWAAGDGWTAVVYARFADDSDGDGRIDLADTPSLWRRRFDGWSGAAPRWGAPVPLTPGVWAAITPRIDRGRVYYAARREGDLDLWSLPLAGALAPLSDRRRVRQALAAASDPAEALFVLRRCAVELAGQTAGQRCRLEAAERLAAAGHPAQAARLFDALAADARQPRLRQRARLGALAAEADRLLPQQAGPSQQAEGRPAARRLLDRLAELEALGGRRRLLRADVLGRVGRWARALAELDGLLDDGGLEPVVRARALLLQADLLERVGDFASAVAALRQVLELGDEGRAARAAAQRLVALQAAGPPATPDAPSAALRRIESLAAGWPPLPPLPAVVRLAVGRRHLAAERWSAARAAFDRLIAGPAAPSDLVAAGRLELARLAEREGDLAAAIEHAMALLRLETRERGPQRRARALIRRLAGVHAEQLAARGDVGMAIAAYRALVDQDPGHIQGQRRLLELQARAGRQRQALTEARTRRQRRPGDALAWYLEGLALTYVDPPARFDQAQAAIERALALDAQNPFAHQTLGWLYEQRYLRRGDKEKLQGAAAAYETALGLLRAGTRPRAASELELNLGNVLFTLGHHRRAAQHYRRRWDSEIGFRLPERRLVFLERFGRAALLSGELAAAEHAFAAAIAQARELKRRDRVPRLIAARAAARQLAGDYDRAARLFERACGWYADQGSRRALARCWRNAAHCHFQRGAGVAALDALRRARTLLAERPRAGAAAEAGRVVSVPLGPGASRAAQGFDRRGELNVIHTLESRLFARAGDRPRAIAALRRRIALLRADARAGQAAARLELAVARNALGWLYWLEGRLSEAAAAFGRSGRTAARVGDARGRVIAGLCRLELAVAAPAVIAPETILAELSRLRAELAAPDALASDLRARLENGLGVAHCLLADAGAPARSSATAGMETGLKAEPEAELEAVLGALDDSLGHLRRAEAHFTAAQRLAADGEGRRMLRLELLAGRNRAALQRRLGKAADTDRDGRRLQRRAQAAALAGVAWRIEGGPPAERAAALEALPPEVAGTRRDAAARRARDRLFADLVGRALDAGEPEQAWRWAERWSLRRRLDAVALEQLEPTTQAGLAALRGLHRRRRALVQALAALEPSAGAEQRAQRRRAVAAARRAWVEQRRRAAAANPLLGALLREQPAGPESLREQLEPGEGVLLALALDHELVVWLLTGDRLILSRRPVARPELDAALAAYRAADPRAAARARERLSTWLLRPLAEPLAGLRRLVAVTDQLPLALGMLIDDEQAIGRRLALVQLHCASDLAGLRRSRRLVIEGGRWIGRAPQPPVQRRLQTLLGSSRHSESAANGPQPTGVVVWDRPLRLDRWRPLRSSLIADPERGALGGLSLGRLAARRSPAGLWVWRQAAAQAPNAALATGLELAMIGAGVASGLWLPRGGTGLADRLLLAVLEHGRTASPARALAMAIDQARRDGTDWMLLRAVQLRGDGGLDLAARQRRARERMRRLAGRAARAFGAERWRAALDDFERVRHLAAFLGRRADLPRLDRLIVTSAFRSGDFDRAAAAERRVLERARQAGAEPDTSRALNRLGVLETRAGRAAAAVELLRRAVAGFERQALASAAAEARTNLARALDAAGRYQEAVQVARRALRWTADNGDARSRLRLLRHIATIELRRLNRPAAARTWFERALALAERSGSERLQAEISLDLARTARATGDTDRSLALIERARTVFERADDDRGRATVALERANSLWYRGDYEAAFAAQRRALAWAEQADDAPLRIMARSLGGLIALNLGDLGPARSALRAALAEARRAGRQDEQAVQLNNLGLVARERGEPERALEHFRAALRIDARLGNDRGRAYDLRNIGIAEQMLGRTASARGHLDRALQLSRAVGDRFNEVKTRIGLARLALDDGALAAAREQATRAHRLAAELDLREVVWRALRTLGEIDRRQGDLEAARRRWRAAIGLVERMPAGLKVDRFRSGFLDDKYDLYADLIHLLLQLDRPAAAFAVSERARAASFADLLARRRFGSTAGGPQRAGPAALRPLDAAAVQAELPRRVALVAFHLSRHGCAAFVVRRDRVVARHLAVERAALRERIARLRRALEQLSPVDAALRRLHRDLIEPLAGALRGAAVVGLLPHDALHYLPFAALRPAGGGWWIDGVRLFRAPSAGGLVRLLQRERRRCGPAGPTLALGDPAPGPSGRRLPFARLEVRALAREQAGARALVGRRASEAALRRLAGDSGYVHLAGHGRLDADDPLASAILLAPGEGHDGRLSAAEVLQLELQARLVVLSACQTGVGDLGRGAEVVGMNRAFLAAGAGGVVSSLWRVGDAASAVLMKRFYRALRRRPPVAALRRAQALVRRYHPHPAHWAGFFLTGGWF
jgi:CHAT domain-containing protein